MIKIAPSILASNFMCLKDEIKAIEEAKADLIHFDVMDGHFVPNLTFGPMILKQAKKCSNLLFDVHLMVNEPHKFIPWYAQNGADIITIHLEASLDIFRDIELIKSLGCKVGLSIKPETNILDIEPYLDYIDLVLVMAVNPGFGGQKFNQHTVERICSIKKMIRNRNILIEVDGGINQDTSKLCIEAGADILVAGTYIFGSDNYSKRINELKGE